MLTFNKKNKGTITQGFDNRSTIYDKVTQGTHNGVDYWLGHGKPVCVDNAGYVYKTFSKGQLDSNWCGVYTLTQTDKEDILMEIVQGHFIENKVEEGDSVVPDQVIGLQGNFGYVFSNYGGGAMRQVPVKDQLDGTAGSYGSHVHESWRPVMKVTERKKGEKYLKNSRGGYYKHQGKYFLQHVNKDHPSGFIDPRDNEYTKTGYQELVDKLMRQITIQMLKTQIAQKLKQSTKVIT